jgi:hypothetical protein
MVRVSPFTCPLEWRWIIPFIHLSVIFVHLSVIFVLSVVPRSSYLPESSPRLSASARPCGRGRLAQFRLPQRFAVWWVALPWPILPVPAVLLALCRIVVIFRDCSIATGADSKIARQEQGETTWDPLNASELAPQLGERLDPKPNCVGQVPTAR